MRLAGDIGGTKVLLGRVDDAGRIHGERRLASADFSRFEDLLGEFLRGNAVPLAGGCLAVAGPVSDDGRSAKITNLPWVIDAAALERGFALPAGSLRLVNDFAGAAMGVTAVAPEQLVTLQAGAPDPRGVRLVVGAGTGLGMAVLLPAHGGWRVLPRCWALSQPSSSWPAPACSPGRRAPSATSAGSGSACTRASSG